MLCYKDMTFCSATDCDNMECPRNTRGPLFAPDEWWSQRVAYSNFKRNCKEFKPKEGN